MSLIKRYCRGGEVRLIWNDQPGLRREGFLPRRASRIEVIPDGPRAGLFHVDMSLLAAETGNPEHQVCLTKTFESYQDANRAEVAWLRAYWLLGGK
jgi:hypothetical protein